MATASSWPAGRSSSCAIRTSGSPWSASPGGCARAVSSASSPAPTSTCPRRSPTSPARSTRSTRGSRPGATTTTRPRTSSAWRRSPALAVLVGPEHDAPAGDAVPRGRPHVRSDSDRRAAMAVELELEAPARLALQLQEHAPLGARAEGVPPALAAQHVAALEPAAVAAAERRGVRPRGEAHLAGDFALGEGGDAARLEHAL